MNNLFQVKIFQATLDEENIMYKKDGHLNSEKIFHKKRLLNAKGFTDSHFRKLKDTGLTPESRISE